MIAARSVVNAISLSRIVIALLFVLTFQRNAVLFYLSLSLCVFALVTDILDGYFARRWGIASIYGRLWDSLGDKSFYIAIIIAFNAQGFLDPLVSWALIVREVALYITRILFIEKMTKLEQIRPWTNWHGYFMYVLIILGLCRMFAELNGRSWAISTYMQISAYAALTFGVGSIIHFLNLE